MDGRDLSNGNADSGYGLSHDTVRSYLEQIPTPHPNLDAVLERGATLRLRKFRIFAAVGAAALIVTVGLASALYPSTMNPDNQTDRNGANVAGAPDRTETSEQPDEGYPGPWFEAPEGWYTDQSGTLPEDTTDLPGAWLSTYEFSQPEYRNLYEELADLPLDGIAIQASILGAEDFPSDPNVNFPKGELPLELDGAEVLNMWEGQVSERIPEYRIWVNIDGQLLDVRVYFGRLNPTEEQYGSAAAALQALRLPERQEIQDGYPSPSFDAPVGWYTDQSGTLPKDAGDLPGAWLSTYEFFQPEYKNLYEELAELPPDGVAILATVIRPELYPSEPNANFPAGDLPLDLDEAEVLNMWEGQIRDIPQYRILVTIDGEMLHVRIYFGRQDPSEEQYETAAEALKTLRMPERD